MKRFLSLGKAAVAMTLALGFCAVPAFSQGTGKTITMIHYNAPPEATSDANSQAFYAVLEKYRKAHPDVTIKDEFITHDNYELKLKNMVASNSLPDVYFSKPDLFPVLREKGLIAPISAYLNADKAYAASFKEGAFNDFNQAGVVWGVPFQLQSNHVVFYNKDLLKKAGYSEFPKTMEDFVEMCKKIKATGVTPIAMGNKGKWLAPSIILNTMVYRYTDGAWFDSLYNKKGAKFTDDAFVSAARLMKTLVDLGAFNPDMNSLSNDQQRDVYYSGTAAMFIEGSWAVAQVIANAPADVKAATGLAVLPPVKGKEKFANIVAGGAGWAVCMNGKIPEARKKMVLDFVKGVFGQEYADISASKGGQPAIKPKIDASKLDPIQAAYSQLPLIFAPIIDVQCPAKIVDVYYNDLQDLLIGKLSPEDYAKHVEAVNN
jgi:raffinose/stachyose/melibiose transport system substrate-binding protein